MTAPRARQHSTTVSVEVIGGVDTHKDTHTAAVIDTAGLGRPAEQRIQRRLLEALRTGVAGEDAKDMAGDVLSGAISLRDAMLSESYSDVFAGSFRRFVEWRSQQSPEALAEAAEIGRNALDEGE
jgi:hypothetical protein